MKGSVPVDYQTRDDLAALHSLSLFTKFFQLAVVLVQGMIVNRLLHPTGRGLVETAIGIVAVVGALQNLGFVGSTVREISATADESRRSATFAVALGMRGTISLITALILWGSAGYLATHVAREPLIAPALRIYGFTILFIPVFQTCEATLMGLQRFKSLFLFYAINTVVNMLATVGLVALRQFEGYFIGQAVGLILGTAPLLLLALGALQWRALLPRSRQELMEIMRALFTVALVVYVAKVLYAQYVGIGAVILKRFVSAEQIGYFGNGKQIALHLLNIAEAANIVNLSVMSQYFTREREAFRATVQRNFAQLLAVIFYGGAAAALFARELILITAGREFLPAVSLVPWFVLAFIFYSSVHITAAGVLVPSNSNLVYLVAYILLTGVSAAMTWLLAAAGWGILGGALALLGGAVVAALYLGVFLWRQFRIAILNWSLAKILVPLLPMWGACAMVESLGLRMLVFVAGSLGWIWIVQRSGLIAVSRLPQEMWARLRGPLATRS